MANDQASCEPLFGLLEALTPECVITLKSTEKEGALRELVSAAAKLDPRLKQKRKELLQAVKEREEMVSTGIGGGVALPHAHISLDKREFLVIIGRSRQGIPFLSGTGEADLAYLVMLVVSDDAKAHTHLRVLSALATLLREEQVRDRIRRARTAEAVLRVFRKVCDRQALPPALSKVTQASLEHAVSIAYEVEAESLLVYANALTKPSHLYFMNWRKRIIFATHTTWHPQEASDAGKKRITVVQIPPVNLTRMGQIRMALLFALSRGLLRKGEVVVCLAGPTGSVILDTILTVDVSDQFGQFLPRSSRDKKSGVEPEVLERVVALACMLAIEGREGKPLGTIFVVGDTKTIVRHVKQLVINPFRGYAAEHLNILDPSMEETIKEFASIDGAFVIRGDGVIISAGTYLTPPPADVEIPGGLGTRHSSASAITAVTNAYAVVISQTAGRVTVFRKGRIFAVIDRPERAQGVLGSG